MGIRIIDIKKVYNSPTEPVSLDDAKAHCRVDFTDDDAYLTTLITQCRRSIENFCHISIVPTVITATVGYPGTLDPFYRSYGTYITAPYVNFDTWFELPYGPLPGVLTSLSTVDADQNVSQLDTTDFNLRGVDYKTLQIINNVWGNAVAVYTTGYDDNNPVPDDLIQALLNEIAFRMEARGDSTNRYAAQNVGVSEAAQYLATPYKRLIWL